MAVWFFGWLHDWGEGSWQNESAQEKMDEDEQDEFHHVTDIRHNGTGGISQVGSTHSDLNGCCMGGGCKKRNEDSVGEHLEGEGGEAILM